MTFSLKDAFKSALEKVKKFLEPEITAEVAQELRAKGYRLDYIHYTSMSHMGVAGGVTLTIYDKNGLSVFAPGNEIVGQRYLADLQEIKTRLAARNTPTPS